MLLQRSPETLRAQSYDKIRPQTFQTIKKKKKSAETECKRISSDMRAHSTAVYLRKKVTYISISYK